MSRRAPPLGERGGRPQRRAEDRAPGRGGARVFLAVLFRRGISGSGRTTADRRPRRADAGEVLGKLEKIGRLSLAGTRVPPRPGASALLERRWRLLELPSTRSTAGTRSLARRRPPAGADPRARARIGIPDDMRIDFVGGLRAPATRGPRRLRRGGLAVSLTDDRRAAHGRSDAGDVMPPKSTWFERSPRAGSSSIDRSSCTEAGEAEEIESSGGAAFCS